MITLEDALNQARKELGMAVYQGETSPYPGIAAINNDRAEWLSRLIAEAERSAALQEELQAAREKISVETPLGRLEAVVGWDYEACPEIYVQIAREDGEEIDLVACAVDVEKEEANACLYGDTRTDSWTERHTWSKDEINIKE